MEDQNKHKSINNSRRVLKNYINNLIRQNSSTGMEKVKKGIGKIKEEQEKIGKEVKERTIGYILAALGLVAGLSWNEAIKSLIDGVFPNSGGGVLIKFVYAIIVTVFIVLVTIYLIRFTQSNNSDKNQN